MKKLSFVIPCYRSADTIGEVVAEITRAMQTELFSGGARVSAATEARTDAVKITSERESYDYEIILVCDGSPDNTFQVIREICETDAHVTGMEFTTNFGQHAALMAGLRASNGDIVICLDDDGQTPADECYKLIDRIEEGADVVYASYEHKQHSGFRNFGTCLNDLMTVKMLGKPKDLHVTSYFAVKRIIVDEMIRYENAYPYVIGLVLRATKNIVNVPVEHRKRETGASGYTLKKLFSLWFNGFTSFSVTPLRISTFCGTLFAVLGFIYGIWTIAKKFINPDVPLGWSSMMAALMFIGGMLMLMMGLVGEYVGRIYVNMNAAPQYVVREVVHKEDKQSGTK